MQYERAIEDYTRAIQLGPESPQNSVTYRNRAEAYYALAQYQPAIKDFSMAIQLNPQSASAYYGRGLAYQELGKMDEAQADFAKYKELTGKDRP